jgi:predicted hotdog family 3-hydroxylacyl-ACP dehydratase
MALITKENILNYIPQRDPICLVHNIYECTEESSKTGFKVEDGHFFVSNGELTEAGIVEHMAQSVAAGAGYMSSLKNLPPKVGFIVNIKDLMIHTLPKTGSEIITTVKLKAFVMNVTLVIINSSCNGKPVSECEMKIFIQE